jgi:hypothetical protein
MTTASNTKLRRLKAIQRHIQRLQATTERLESLNERFTWYRLGTLIAAGIFSYLAFSTGSLYFGWSVLLLSVAAFVVVVYFHRRLDESRLRFQYSLAWFCYRSQSGRGAFDPTTVGYCRLSGRQPALAGLALGPHTRPGENRPPAKPVV